MLEFYVVPFKQLRKGFGHFFGFNFRGLWDVCYLVNLALVFLVLLPLYFFFPDVAEAQTVRLFWCPIWIYCSGAPIHRSFWQFFWFQIPVTIMAGQGEIQS